ncbi:MAG: ribonuclease HI [Candidatus Marinimicrobia bacterium]|nr:ribonuclease HI [Candidatus Neomarinimicrobiota bacterium]
MIKIYTDGACSGNPGQGGWGVVVSEGGVVTKTYSGYAKETTNNRMELTAAIMALKIAKKLGEIRLYTDSNYVKQGITSWINNWKKNGWKTSNKKDVKNKDLWQKLDDLNNDDVEWYYVPGHSGVKLNEIADDLATNMVKYNQEDKD